MPAIMSCRVGGSLIPTRAETSQLISEFDARADAARYARASVKKTRRPVDDDQIRGQEAHHHDQGRRPATRRDRRYVLRSMALHPSIMIIRKTAAARGVRYP